MFEKLTKYKQEYCSIYSNNEVVRFFMFLLVVRILYFDAISVLDAHWSVLTPIPDHPTIHEGAVTELILRTCANRREPRLMEKILALIAVSLGKKVTVYAVGRVSMCIFCYVIDSGALGEILCKVYPFLGNSALIVIEFTSGDS